MGKSDSKKVHQRLIAFISSGTDFVKIQDTEIDGNILRKILLGIPVSKKEGGSDTIVEMPANGMKLSQVIIRHGIDLSESINKNNNSFPPLIFENCSIEGIGFRARHSFFSRLHFSKCTIKNRLDVTNSSFLKGLEITGLKSKIPIHAADISVEGSLIISETTLQINDDSKSYAQAPSYYPSYALDISHASISGSVYLRPQFMAMGGINAEGSKIHGDFWADGAFMRGYQDDIKNGYAFFGRSLYVRGALNLCYNRELEEKEYFKTEGKISLFGARLGFLFMRGCILRSQNENDTFNCYCLQIENSAILSMNDEKFVAKIKVDFNSAKINGKFNAKGAVFTEFSGHNMLLGTEMNFENVSAERISISGSEIKSNLYLNFINTNILSAKGIIVGGIMTLGGEFEKVSLRESTIYGSLRILEIRRFVNSDTQTNGDKDDNKYIIDLRGARVMHTLDDKDGEVFKGNFILKLNGFKYERFGPGSDRHPKSDKRYSDRLKWLMLQFEKGKPTKEKYDPQPFHQVVKVFKSQGQYNNSLELLKERLKIESNILYDDQPGKKNFQMVWGKLFDFGLSRKKSFLVLFSVWIVGFIITFLALENGCFVQTNSNLACNNAIQPVWYSFDVLLPLLDVGQEAKCEIMYSQKILRGFFAVYKVFGWIVVSIFILSLTGFVKRQQE